MIVLDTNILSELMRGKEAARAVVTWSRINAGSLAIPSVALGELRYGVGRLADGRRKSSLDAVLASLVRRFAGRILAYDAASAEACGRLLAAAEAAGRPMSLPDAQIAAIAKVARASLATRNKGDFALARLALIDPWTA